ncbi:FADL397C-Bp [Eremothecium gossypii FDAG1]|nr:FADL397C-Bp [Eremothecium gossypii FDAG1]
MSSAYWHSIATMKSIFSLVTCFLALVTSAVVQASQEEQQAAVQLRKLIKDESSFQLTTINQNGTPYGIRMYYISPDRCEGVEHDGQPIFLMVDTTLQQVNAKNNNNVSFSVASISIEDPMKAPRANFAGELEVLQPIPALQKCFADVHPDAKPWIPSGPSPVKFYRFKIKSIYYVAAKAGYNGYIDPALYANAN